MSEHSPLGASGAARWMPCPGSVTLSRGIVDDEDDTFSAPGTVAHMVAERCLYNGRDAWLYINSAFYSGEAMVWVDKEMADAVQIYLDAVREHHHLNDFSFSDGSDWWVEMEFHCPEIHKDYWGTADFVSWKADERTLHVWDYKHGAGIVVEAYMNVQCMYYACGVLTKMKMWKEVDQVTLHIAQPRGFHWDGPIRSFTIPITDLASWLANDLIPAMHVAADRRNRNVTKSGEHCRFCPARSHACPQLIDDLDELEAYMDEMQEKGGGAEKLTPDQVGRFLDLIDVAKIVAKAAEKTAFGMLMAGEKVPGRKLVKARSNRQWKECHAQEEDFWETFGDQGFTPSVQKSPSAVEKLPLGKAFAARWAFKPDKGLTLKKASDNRVSVDRDTKSIFTAR